MKAVNLIPSDSQKQRDGKGGGRSLGPGFAVVGLLTVALGLVTVYVLAQNSITEGKAKLASDQRQLTTVQAEVTRLNAFTQFEQLAQARVATIRQIATSRFDWHSALSDLSRVVPANTSLQSLTGTVSPDATVSGGGGIAGGSGASGQALRGAISAPAFELTGCTKTQDDVARLMSRLRLMNGVTRVTLGGSQESDTAQGGVSAATGSSTGCGGNAPTFDLVVFFKPLPGAASTGTSASPATTASTATAATTSATSAATAPQPSSTSSTTSQTTSTSVSSTGASGATK